MKSILRFLKDEEGATMAEYALLLGLITVAIVTVISAFRDSLSGTFTRTTTTLNSVQWFFLRVKNWKDRPLWYVSLAEKRKWKN